MRSIAVLRASRRASARRCKMRSGRHALCISVLADTRTFEDSNQCLSASSHSAAAAAEWRTFWERAIIVLDMQHTLDTQQLKELLLQSLEHERAGVAVYEAAIRCAVSGDLKQQWSEYLKQTRRSEEHTSE